MRNAMGEKDFEALRERVTLVRGEPDLFCWDDQGHWFFAEAKGVGDRMRDSQRMWIDVCDSALGGRADIRVYQVIPQPARQ